ncbi:alanine racemase [Cellulomonas sp. URHE0023]|uniref:alanine racemase n=1 Tax=Cellulomonas sp. URHE0023 TaxID=1380354 RepID=UPI000551697F|nr:alanine racemase [Cellulomonas sp. URHE0023]
MTVHVPTTLIGPTTKGFWQPEPVTADAFTAAGHTLEDGSLTFPVLTLDADALAHNIAEMAGWTRDRGLDFAPHGKTTMSPEIFAAQLAAGAWGMTVATGNQLLTAYELGVRRILVANEVVDPTVLRWIAGCDDAEILFYVDSVEGVALAAAAGGPVTVLLEVGYDRTGVRSREQAMAVTQAIAATDTVSLRGVSAYEGGCATLNEARAFLAEVRAFADELRPFIDGEVVLSAGGSAYFDAVAAELRPFPGGRTILRSGSYVTHDHGTYVASTPFTRITGSLHPALRLWAQVLSTPTDGLALVGAGKRDVPYDAGLPVVLDKAGWTVTRTNDQHAFLEAGAEADPLHPGDVLELGISHPCTAFDKWRVIPVLDADRRVVDVVTTWF